MTVPTSTPKQFWRWLTIIVAIIALILPAWIFFQDRGITVVLLDRDARQFARFIFPLFGLYAFTLVWMQILLGSLMRYWVRVFPKILSYHKAQGTFALLFALTHPTLLLFGVGVQSYFQFNYVPSNKVPFLFFGYVALFCLLLTVISARLIRTKLLQKYWRRIHYLNYVVFFSAGIHSYFIGSDIRTSVLKHVWLGYAVTVVFATIVRVFVSRKKLPPQTASIVSTKSQYPINC